MNARCGPQVPVFALVLLLLPLPFQPVQAKDITRSCTGFYGANLIEINGIRATGTGARVGSMFSASGTCGSVVPDRCRERASGKLRRCMQAHWSQRWDFVEGGTKEGQVPPECSHVTGVSRYAVSNIKLELETAACCEANSPNLQTFKDVVIELRGWTYGKRMCGEKGSKLLEFEYEEYNDKFHLEDRYEVNCRRFRRKYGCPASFETGIDRPGANYRDFELSSAYPQLCHAACKGENRCKAWTYVHPGIQGARAHCWLKDGVPDNIKLSCCISGKR